MGGDRFWERMAALAGAASVGLLLLGILLLRAPPERTAPAQDISVFFTQFHRRALIQSALLGGSAPLFVWFAASLRRRIADPGESGSIASAAFGGAIVVSAFVMLGALFVATLALGAAEALSVARPLYLMTVTASKLIDFPAGLFLAGAAVAGLRTRSLPLWLCFGGLAVAAAHAVDALGLTQQTGSLSAGGRAGLVVHLLFALWVLGASLVLFAAPLSSPEPAPAAPPEPSPPPGDGVLR